MVELEPHRSVSSRHQLLVHPELELNIQRIPSVYNIKFVTPTILDKIPFFLFFRACFLSHLFTFLMVVSEELTLVDVHPILQKKFVLTGQ